MRVQSIVAAIIVAALSFAVSPAIAQSGKAPDTKPVCANCHEKAHDTIMLTAQRLEAAKLACGLSTKLTSDEQAKLTGDAWERLPEPKPRFNLEIIAPDGSRKEYLLGPHTPRLRDEDLALMHELWLQLTRDPRHAGLHHYSVVGLALKELKRELTGPERERLMRLLDDELENRGGPPRPN